MSCIRNIITLQINFLQSDWLRGGKYKTIYTVSKLPLKGPAFLRKIRFLCKQDAERPSIHFFRLRASGSNFAHSDYMYIIPCITSATCITNNIQDFNRLILHVNLHFKSFYKLIINSTCFII